MRTRRLRNAIGATSAIVLSAAGLSCGTEPIDVATLPGPEAGHAPCSVDAVVGQSGADGGLGGCEPGEYCEPAACGESNGTCEVLLAAATCTAPYSPVCGCDGMTYFNDCLRQSVGKGATGSGACGVPEVPCGTTDECARNDAGSAVCALVVPGELLFMDPTATVDFQAFLCSVPTTLPENFGTCWVLPESAPPGSGSKKLRQVQLPPKSCGLGGCLNPYEALQAGGVFIEDGNCP